MKSSHVIWKRKDIFNERKKRKERTLIYEARKKGKVREEWKYLKKGKETRKERKERKEKRRKEIKERQDKTRYKILSTVSY